MDVLRFEHYSFAYPCGLPGRPRPDFVLKDVDLRIAQGDFALLVGATGSGKTTLLRCAKCEVAPRGSVSGALLEFGVDVADASSSPDVGYVAQDPDTQIVCDVVWRELAFGLECKGVAQSDMRRRIAEVSNYFGIESWFSRKTAHLSGGQKQMLNLASVLAMQPKMVLLDEPTAELDPIAAQTLTDMLRRLNREFGMTILLATHDPEQFADCATAIWKLESGRVAPMRLDGSRDIPQAEPAPAIVRGDAGYSEGVVELNDVWYRYDADDEWVLRGMNLMLERGKVSAIVGGNGSGKTTLLKAIANIVRPQRGYVRNVLLGNQAYLPQDPKLLFSADTVGDELMEWSASAGFSVSEAHQLTRLLGIEDMWGAFPLDVSRGQQQKLALAKLLLARPELLLLDEPTKGLDAASLVECGCILQTVARWGVAVVMATHDVTFASRVADSITMVFDGANAVTQSPQDFCRDAVFYRDKPCSFARLWDERKQKDAFADVRLDAARLNGTKTTATSLDWLQCC